MNDFETLVEAISAGDDRAMSEFFDAHYSKLVRYAKKRIGSFALRTVDEEDIAVCAINSFFRGMTERKFDISNSAEFWKLLVTITNRKLTKHRQSFTAQKRGGGQVRGHSLWQQGDQTFEDSAVGSEDQPDVYLELMDTTEQLFGMLEDEKMREVARLLLEGYSIKDISEELDCVRRTVERKISRIREIWGETLSDG